MTIEELLLEIKAIPNAMIKFDNKIIDNESNIDYNINFLEYKLTVLQAIYDTFISEEVQEYISPTKIRLVCENLEYIINYISELISYLKDASKTLEADVKAVFYDDDDAILSNGAKITKINFRERYDATLDMMVLYMDENHEKFENMYITNMNISDVLYQPAKTKK